MIQGYNGDYQIVAANDLLIISNFYPRERESESVRMISLMDETLVMTMNGRVKVKMDLKLWLF